MYALCFGGINLNKMMYWIKKEAVLCISFIFTVVSMFFVPPSKIYIHYIDFRVLCLLFCLMIVVAGLQNCGLFIVLAQKLLSGEKKLRMLFLVLVLLPFFSSMFITNDVALITFVPFTILVLKMIGRTQYIIYIVVLQTIAANLGSMTMPVGNPQNLFLYADYQISMKDFFTTMLPFTFISFVVLSIASVCVKRENIRVSFSSKETIQKPFLLIVFLFLFLLCLLSVFHILPYQILTIIVIVCIFIFEKKLLMRVDYSLLFTFVCFFTFAGNIGQIVIIREFLMHIMEKNTLVASLFASQIISNVPAAVLLSDFTQNWKQLLIGVNIGGLGTPIASLASLISLKFYLNLEEAKPISYLCIFLAANSIGLILLCTFYFFLL